eukprot:13745-Heterococcus_DN1.PRE.1
MQASAVMLVLPLHYRPYCSQTCSTNAPVLLHCACAIGSVVCSSGSAAARKSKKGKLAAAKCGPAKGGEYTTGQRSFSEQLTKWKKQLRPEEIRAVEVGCADMYAQIYPDLGIGLKKTQKGADVVAGVASGKPNASGTGSGNSSGNGSGNGS